MKKTLTLILTFALLLTLTACGSNEQSGKSVTTPPASPAVNDETAESQTEKIDVPEPTLTTTTPAEETEIPTVPPTVAETIPITEAPSSANEIRSDFKDAMDSYEAFYVEYCDFMKKYKENPTDFTLLAKYGDLVTREVEMAEAFEAWKEADLNDAELKYYMEVNARVLKMLAEILS